MQGQQNISLQICKEGQPMERHYHLLNFPAGIFFKSILAPKTKFPLCIFFFRRICTWKRQTAMNFVLDVCQVFMWFRDCQLFRWSKRILQCFSLSRKISAQQNVRVVLQFQTKFIYSMYRNVCIRDIWKYSVSPKRVCVLCLSLESPVQNSWCIFHSRFLQRSFAYCWLP